MKQVRFLIEAALFGLLLQMARVTPRSFLRFLGAGAGLLGYLLDSRHRAIALDNLSMAYGSSPSSPEMRRIARECWIHFGRILFDALAFHRLSAATAGRVVRYEGLEHIRNAYARGKGVLLFSAHYGHWELVALMQGYLGLPLSLVTRPLDNRRLEKMLVRLRGGSGNRIVHKRNAVREMLAAVRNGSGVAIVIDQDAHEEGVFVPFFNRPASTTPTLALLALRTGAAVVPVFSVPQSDGSYLVTYEPEVRVHSTGDRDADVHRLTGDCTAIIERWVRKHPELWLWMHRRWKTKESSDVDPWHGRG